MRESFESIWDLQFRKRENLICRRFGSKVAADNIPETFSMHDKARLKDLTKDYKASSLS